MNSIIIWFILNDGKRLRKYEKKKLPFRIVWYSSN